jgi:glucose-6-phosphate isomerase
MNLRKKKVWAKLKKHHQKMKSLHLKDLFAREKNRFSTYSLQGPEIFLDYSKNHVARETLSLFEELTDAIDLTAKTEAMFLGEEINNTEHRAVLHTALRTQSDTPIMVAGKNILPNIRHVFSKMRHFSDEVRSQAWKGFTGKPITDIVNIGIGGSDLGPKLVNQALTPHYGLPQLKGHFVFNIDGTQIAEVLKKVNPETTLFVIASKTFTTLETITNAETARDWLVKAFGNEKAVAKHFVAISTNEARVKAFGIDPENMFEFWDWVGGRYSVWSAIGLPIALLIGMDHFEAFLAGAYQMDRHFCKQSALKNLPVLLALLRIWYRNFFGCASFAVIPYDHYLHYFTPYLQQMDMESNGKSVDVDGHLVAMKTGPVVWGGIGTDCQHSFHQLLHQGTDIVPVDFIIARESLHTLRDHHLQLYSNCLAQSQALLQGKTEKEAYDELIAKSVPKEEAKKLAPHKVMQGNRPSNTLSLERLTPSSLGALIALYEHSVFVQGKIWEINSFDQWGVELGKQLASKIGPYLSSNQSLDAFDSSTRGLIERFRK